MIDLRFRTAGLAVCAGLLVIVLLTIVSMRARQSSVGHSVHAEVGMNNKTSMTQSGVARQPDRNNAGRQEVGDAMDRPVLLLRVLAKNDEPIHVRSLQLKGRQSVSVSPHQTAMYESPPNSWKREALLSRPRASFQQRCACRSHYPTDWMFICRAGPQFLALCWIPKDRQRARG